MYMQCLIVKFMIKKWQFLYVYWFLHAHMVFIHIFKLLKMFASGYVDTLMKQVVQSASMMQPHSQRPTSSHHPPPLSAAIPRPDKAEAVRRLQSRFATPKDQNWQYYYTSSLTELVHTFFQRNIFLSSLCYLWSHHNLYLFIHLFIYFLHF